MYYDTQKTKSTPTQPQGDIGGWLGFITVRLVFGSVSGVIALAGLLFRLIPIMAQPFLLERAGADVVLLLVVSMVMYVAALALVFAATVTLFRKRKSFFLFYIIYALLSAASYVLVWNPLTFCMIVALESVNIAYLLTAKRPAMRFRFYNRFNRAALAACQAKNFVGDEAEEILSEINRTAKAYRSCKLSHEAYEQRLRMLIDRL